MVVWRPGWAGHEQYDRNLDESEDDQTLELVPTRYSVEKGYDRWCHHECDSYREGCDDEFGRGVLSHPTGQWSEDVESLTLA